MNEKKTINNINVLVITVWIFCTIFCIVVLVIVKPFAIFNEINNSTVAILDTSDEEYLMGTMEQLYEEAKNTETVGTWNDETQSYDIKWEGVNETYTVSNGVKVNIEGSIIDTGMFGINPYANVSYMVNGEYIVLAACVAGDCYWETELK